MLRQTIIDQLDVILLNCQNIDNEYSIYEKYLQHPNIREIKLDSYCTLYHSWNVGINNTTASFVMNSNADDMLRKDACEEMLKCSESHDVIFSYYAISNKPNRYSWDGSSPKNLIQPTSWDRLFLGPSPMIRKSILSKTGLYDHELYAIGDSDLWGRLNKVGARARMIEEPLVLYYHNKASLERRRNSKGEPLTWADSQIRKAKNAASWTPENPVPIYPILRS